MSESDNLPLTDPLHRQTLVRATFRVDAKTQSVAFAGGSTPSAIYSVGDIVGDSYRLVEQLGRGGMGVVYIAEHLIINQRYALKLLAPDQVNPDNWKRFEIEGKALARLNHDNIVRIYNMGVDKKGCPFYVMDFLPGKSLFDLMAQHKVSGQDCLRIYRQVCDGLGSAHQKGIVHRDVKPSNIMINGDLSIKGAVKIVDFGIASLSSDMHEQSQTTLGEIFGSPAYMSPEQCVGARVDARSDIYSLGCSMFETLTDKPPFCGKTSMDTIAMHEDKIAPSLTSASGRTFTSSIEQMMARLLQKDPRKRYQTTEQLAHDLDRILEGKSLDKSAVLQSGMPVQRVAAPGSEEQAAVEPATRGDANFDKKRLLFISAAAVLTFGAPLVVYLLLSPVKNVKSHHAPVTINQEDLHPPGAVGKSVVKEYVVGLRAG